MLQADNGDGKKKAKNLPEDNGKKKKEKRKGDDSDAGK